MLNLRRTAQQVNENNKIMPSDTKETLTMWKYHVIARPGCRIQCINLDTTMSHRFNVSLNGPIIISNTICDDLQFYEMCSLVYSSNWGIYCVRTPAWRPRLNVKTTYILISLSFTRPIGFNKRKFGVLLIFLRALSMICIEKCLIVSAVLIIDA